jgi:predicted nucleic acid-binding protein
MLAAGRAPFMGDLILCEVMQGSRSDVEFDTRLRYFGLLPVVQISDETVAVEAARLYRGLRTQGVTVRKTIDCLIAARCLIDDIPLLYRDRDFDHYVARFGLRSAMPSGVF